MAGEQHNLIKPELYAKAALGLLERELAVSQLVWKWSAMDFAGALDDTINVKVPGRFKAKDRDLRATGEDRRIKLDYLTESTLGVKLTKFPYHATSITDEQLTLDIADFATIILAPQVRAMQEYIEDMVVEEIVNAPYEDGRFDDDFNVTDKAKVKGTLKMEDFYGPGKMGAHALFNRLSTLFSMRNIPANDRVVVAGAEIAEEIRNAPNLVKANEAGDSSALRDATIGKLSGFTIVESNQVPTDQMFAYHKTAFTLATAAPVVPTGAVFGASQATPQTALRWLRDYDANYAEDRSIVDCFAGTNHMNDLDKDGKEHFLRGFKVTADLNKVADLRAKAGDNPTVPAA